MGICKSLIPALLGTVALLTSFLFSFWCESFKFNPISSDNINLPTLYGGPWYQRDVIVEGVSIDNGVPTVYVRDTCVEYPSGSRIDSKWKAVRAYGIIAVVMGGSGLFALWLAPCLYCMSAGAWKSLAMKYAVIVTLFQGLTFLIFRSNACKESPLFNSLGLVSQALYPYECDWSGGSTCNVISIVFWFLTGVAMMAVGVPTREKAEEPRPVKSTEDRPEQDVEETHADMGKEDPPEENVHVAET